MSCVPFEQFRPALSQGFGINNSRAGGIPARPIQTPAAKMITDTAMSVRSTDSHFGMRLSCFFIVPRLEAPTQYRRMPQTAVNHFTSPKE